MSTTRTPSRSAAGSVRPARPLSRPEAPVPPTGKIVLQPPPPVVEHEGAAGVLMNAIPMLGSIGAIVVIASLSAQGGATGTRALLAAGMFGFATLGFVAVQIDRQRKQRARRVTGSRGQYLRYLADVRAAVRDAADAQRRAALWHHPAPSALPALAADQTRVWERGTSNEEFARVRWGTCTQPLAVELVPPGAPVSGGTTDQPDPASASALHRLLAVHRTQPDLPATLDLGAHDRVELVGPDRSTRALARSLICEAVTFHSPDQLVVAVLSAETNLEHWDWLKWLPHAHSERRSDAVGPMRMVSTSLAELAELLPADLADRPRFGAEERPTLPHVLLVIDGAEVPATNLLLPSDGLQGVTLLELAEQAAELGDPTRVRLHLTGPAQRPNEPAGVEVQRLREPRVSGLADQCDLPTAEALARRLSPMAHHASRTSDTADHDLSGLGGGTGLLDLLDLGDVRTVDPGVTWQPRPGRDRLRVPIGVGESGVVHLDLKESAQQGMGPHGLVIGATGSGKSEFLRTLVLGLALTHSPESLNLVLVDFKGGATFATLDDLPHTSAVITNLSQELSLVDRMQDALAGEMVRRQELLRAGNFASVRDYERARAAGERLAPLPSLFIVVDEFSELLSAKPEFIDIFVAIGRLGRSLGLHLLLASQRLDEGRLRGLESHLSYRIGLRTFSAAESRAVLGVPDAYELPATPGLGLLKPDPTTLLGFRAAYVSGPAPRVRERVQRDEGGNVHGILPFTISEVLSLELPRPVTEPEPEPEETESVLEVAVARLRGRGRAAHQVWLPPLEEPATLGGLMPDLQVLAGQGLVSPTWRARGGLMVPVGIVDRPREQRRDAMTISLAGAGGNVAVVGGPRSGKSTLLRTIITATALATTPLETSFYLLDFGGGSFLPLADLPQVAGLGTRAEPDVVRRVIAEVSGIIEAREAYFRAQGIDSIETYRTRRREGRADDGYGEVYLVIDGWSTLRSDFEDLELELQTLAGRCLTFGVHLIVGASRWAEFRSAMRDVFGTRLELRLGDPIDSDIDRKLAAAVPTGRPGRGLVPSRLHFLGALPRLDAATDTASQADGLAALVRRVADAWNGPAGPKLRLLPSRVDLAQVQAASPTPEDRRILIGLDEKDLAPVGLEVDDEPHLLVFGDGRSGKTALLRSYIREITRTRTPAQAQIVVVDYRRSLLGEVPEEYQLNYLTNASQSAPLIRELAKYLENRIPGPDVTPEQLRTRSWWQGAEVFVLIDDYDLVAAGQSSPVQPLLQLMSQARDVGLHVVIARRSGGAARALYEPMIQSMRDLAMPGIVLSGSPEEGFLLGKVRPERAPAGRGRLVTRDRGVEVVQLAWTPPAEL